MDHQSSNSGPMNRRAFLGSVTLTVGGVAAAALLPLSLRAAPRNLAAVAALTGTETGTGEVCGEWDIDDACGSSLYSYPIPYGWQYSTPLAAQVDPVDRIFMG